MFQSQINPSLAVTRFENLPIFSREQACGRSPALGVILN
jgi:hypothetical protein